MLEMVLMPVFILIAHLILLLPMCRHNEMWPVDEGFYVYPALQIYKGKAPYRDFHSGYTPLKSYILAILFRIFGLNLVTARIYWTAVASAIPVAIYYLTFFVTGSLTASLLSVLFYLTDMFPNKKNYGTVFIEIGRSSDRMLAGLIAMIASFAFYKYDIYPFLIASGLITGAAYLWGQEIGFFSTVSITALILLLSEDYLRDIIVFSLGILFVLTCAAFFFYFKGISLRLIINESILAALDFKDRKTCRLKFSSLSDVVPNSFNLERLDYFYSYHIHRFIFNIKFYLPFLAYPAVLLYLISEGLGSAQAYIISILIFSFLSLLILRERPDYPHLLRSKQPFYIVLGFIIFSLVTHRSSPITLYILMLFSLLTFYQIVQFVRSYCEDLSDMKKKVILDGERGGIYVLPEYADTIKRVVNFLKTHTAEPERILSIPHDSIINFLSDRDSATKLQAFFPFHKREEIESALCEIDRVKPAYVIKNSSGFNKSVFDGSPFYKYAGRVSNYIEKNYFKVESFGFYEILSRRA